MFSAKAFLAALFLGVLAGAPISTVAQSASPTPPTTPPTSAPNVSSGASLVLVPYEEPGGTDPHAVAVTKTLSADLASDGVTVTAIDPVDHLEAVSTAASICAAHHATGLLVPEGRYEQTLKRFSVSFFLTVLKYPTHVEFRLDDIGCDGHVRWSTTTTGDQTPSGVDSVGNIGAAVDAAFSSAVEEAAHRFASASIPPDVAASATAAPTPTPGASAAPVSTYLLLPFAQPGVADPRADDITHSLLTQLQARKLNVTVGTPIDHLSAIASAAQLCSANNAQAIIVPNVRIEQSSYSGHSHASLRLTILSCGGSVERSAFTQADMGSGFIGNFGAAAVGVSERAMGPALDKLFPSANG